MGEYAKALPSVQQSLAINRKGLLGPGYPLTALSLGFSASLHLKQGEYAQALTLDQQVLAIRSKTLGPEHPETAATLNNLGQVYHAMGEFDKAVPLLRQSLDINRKAFGPEHLQTAESLDNLADLYSHMGRYAAAAGLAKQGADIDNKLLNGVAPSLPDSQAMHFIGENCRGMEGLLEPPGAAAAGMRMNCMPSFGKCAACCCGSGPLAGKSPWPTRPHPKLLFACFPTTRRPAASWPGLPGAGRQGREGSCAIITAAARVRPTEGPVGGGVGPMDARVGAAVSGSATLGRPSCGPNCRPMPRL